MSGRARKMLGFAVGVVFGLLLLGSLASAQDSPPPPTSVVATTATQAVQAAQLTRTGSDPWPLVLVSGVLLVVGSTLVVGARHRRRLRTQPG